MKVLTLNTHSWLESQPLEKLQQLADHISTENYALIALQEVNQRINSLPVVSTHNFHPTKHQQPIHEDNFAHLLVQLLKEQGHNYHWSWTYNHIGYDTYHEGVALLSKQPIQPKAVLVSKEKNPDDHHTRLLLIGQTKLAESPITAVCCHYSWWLESGGFSYEWQQTEQALKSQTLPLLLMGDFNNPASVAQTGYDLVLTSQLHLQDSFLAANKRSGEHTVEKAIDGWGENQEKLRIDYIFASQELAISNYRIIFDGKQTPVISDHFGVAVTVN